MLLQFLKRPEVAPRISWDGRGTVTIDGDLLTDSNIIDLVNDVARSRKSVKAVGREEFARFLYESGIPLEFMGNSELYKLGRKLVQIDISSSTPVNNRVRGREEFLPSTPLHNTHDDSFHSINDTIIAVDTSLNGSKRKKKRDLNKSLNKSLNQSGGGWLTLSM